MKLTQFTDYSLRVLIYLAQDWERKCTIREIAQWHKISKPHLVKVVHQLTKLNYIKTFQGKGGGISLKVIPSKINIGKVVRETESDFHIVECFDIKSNRCRIIKRCKLKYALHEAKQAFLKVLDLLTLEDISAADDKVFKKVE